MKTKHISIYALFLAFGVIANYIEHLLPLPFIFPGVKLGLSNAVGLIVLSHNIRLKYWMVNIRIKYYIYSLAC